MLLLWDAGIIMNQRIESYLQDDKYDQLLAYIAGFFDGEGCIYINRWWDKRRGCYEYALNIEVSNTNPAPLKILKEIFGGKVKEKSRNSTKTNWRKAWKWVCKSRMSETFLEKMLPYLIIKQDEARLALEYRKTCEGKCFRKLTNCERDRRDFYYYTLSALKRKEYLV